METQKQFEIDFGNLMAFNPHHHFPSLPSSRLGFSFPYINPYMYMGMCFNSGFLFFFQVVQLLNIYVKVLILGFFCLFVCFVLFSFFCLFLLFQYSQDLLSFLYYCVKLMLSVIKLMVDFNVYLGFICFFFFRRYFLGKFLFQKAKIFRNLIAKTRSRTFIEINIFMALPFVAFWSQYLNSERVYEGLVKNGSK